jgi:DUF1009 family protein
MTLPFLNRAGVGIVKGDNPVFYVLFAGKFQQRPHFKNIQKVKHVHSLLFPLIRSFQRPDFHLNDFQGGNEHFGSSG